MGISTAKLRVWVLDSVIEVSFPILTVKKKLLLFFCRLWWVSFLWVSSLIPFVFDSKFYLKILGAMKGQRLLVFVGLGFFLLVPLFYAPWAKERKFCIINRHAFSSFELDLKLDTYNYYFDISLRDSLVRHLYFYDLFFECAFFFQFGCRTFTAVSFKVQFQWIWDVVCLTEVTVITLSVLIQAYISVVVSTKVTPLQINSFGQKKPLHCELKVSGSPDWVYEFDGPI